jgi:hypothetical protein
VAVPLQFDGDHLAMAGEQIEHVAEHAGQPVPAVHDDQRRPAAAPALPVDVDVARGGVAAFCPHVSLLAATV